MWFYTTKSGAKQVQYGCAYMQKRCKIQKYRKGEKYSKNSSNFKRDVEKVENTE